MPIDWTDKRPITDLRFGAEWKPTIGDLQAQQPGFGEAGAEFPLRPGDPPTDEVLAQWKEAHGEKLAGLRAILATCACVIAEDIVQLGCAGVSAHVPGEIEARIKTAQLLRIGLGGSGVGLPCYVPPDRYCLIHEVAGGLQDGQEQRYPEEVPNVSRELTDAERAQSELTDHARRSSGSERERGAADVLAGRTLPEGWEREGSTATTAGSRWAGAVDLPAASTQSPFVCPEHKEPNWSCRFCVAQMVVEGPLEPKFLVYSPHPTGDPQFDIVKADDVEKHIETCDGAGCQEIAIFALAAAYAHKLTRVK